MAKYDFSNLSWDDEDFDGFKDELLLKEWPFLYRGTMTVLSGPANSGKSTMLRILSRKLMEQKHVVYLISEERAEDVRRKQLAVGLVQNHFYQPKVAPGLHQLYRDLTAIQSRHSSSRIVLIIDTFKTFHEACGVRSTFSDRSEERILLALRKWCRERSICVLITTQQLKVAEPGRKGYKEQINVALGKEPMTQIADNVLRMNNEGGEVTIHATGRDVGTTRWSCMYLEPTDYKRAAFKEWTVTRSAYEGTKRGRPRKRSGAERSA